MSRVIPNKSLGYKGKRNDPSVAAEVLKIGKRCRHPGVKTGSSCRMCLGKLYRVCKNDGLLIILHAMLLEAHSIPSRVSYRGQN